MNSTIPPKTKPKPGAAMYLVPLFVWVLFSAAAFAGGGVKVLNATENSVEDLERVSAIAGGAVSVEKGSQVVYYEERGDFGVSSPQLSFKVIDPSGTEVDVTAYGDTGGYATELGDGVPIGVFDAEQTGNYSIVVTDAGLGYPGALAVGGDVFDGVKTGAAIFIGVGTLGFVIALVVAIVIARKRGRSKRQIGQSGPSGQSFPPPGDADGMFGAQPMSTEYAGVSGFPASSAPQSGASQSGASQPPADGFPPTGR